MSKTLSLDRFSSEARSLVAAAQAHADELKNKRVLSLHLLVQLLQRGDGVAAAFRLAGADPDRAEETARAVLGKLPAGADAPAVLSGEMLDLLARAEREAGAHEVTTADLLHALAQEAEGPARLVLSRFSIRPGAFREVLPAPPRSEHADDDAGAALLRDFASEVRGGLDRTDHEEVRRRGSALFERVHELLTGPDAIPGLTVTREDATTLVLRRAIRPASVNIRWERDAGAVAVTAEAGPVSTRHRYVYDRDTERWLEVGSGEGFYTDLRATIRTTLFPELAAS